MPRSPFYYSRVTADCTKQRPLALPNQRFDFFNVFGGWGVGVGLDDMKGSFPFGESTILTVLTTAPGIPGSPSLQASLTKVPWTYQEGRRKWGEAGRAAKDRGTSPPEDGRSALSPSLPFLTFAAFLTLGVGDSVVTWVRREKRQRSR